jgi:hypothetical protein
MIEVPSQTRCCFGTIGNPNGPGIPNLCAYVAGRSHDSRFKFTSEHLHIVRHQSSGIIKEVISEGRLMKVAGGLSSFFTEKFLRSFVPRKFAARVVAVTIAGPIVVSITTNSRADEGGVSFWVPGFYGSLAATPQVPGFHSPMFFIIRRLKPAETSRSPSRCPPATSM